VKKWILLVGLLALTAPMFGAIVIDFGDGGVTTGTITNNAATIDGVGISVEIMKVSINGPFTSYHTTGTCDGGAGNLDGSACLDFSFNKATGIGNIHIVGGVIGLPNPPNTIPNGTTLLSGTGDSFTFSIVGDQITVRANGPDTKDSNLLAALGLSAFAGLNKWNIIDGFSIGARQVAGGNVFNAFSTDIPNSPVPEPASILLLGTVLFGVTHSIRRRMVSKG